MNKKFILIITGIIVIFIVAILYLNINKNDENGGNIVNIERTGWAKDIPSNYKTNAKEQGKLEKVEYSSIDYTNNNEITKEAVVYLPFGYGENKKYNIYYLMHGWTGHAGDFFQYSNLKNILDNMIENKDIEPLIVGLFHYLMPFIGKLFSLLVINKVIEKSNLIISIIFMVLAYEIYKSKDSQKQIFVENIIMMIFIAVTVSIDSLLVGLALSLKHNNIYLASLIFSVVSCFVTFVGIKIGNKIRYKYHNYAIYLGIIILMGLSLKYLIS